VTLENQIRGLTVVFGIRLPRALTAAFVNQALKASEGVAGLSAAMRGLIAARTAVMTAVAAIDADMRRMTRASAACRRLMTIPGVSQLTALAFVAAIDLCEPSDRDPQVDRDEAAKTRRSMGSFVQEWRAGQGKDENFARWLVVLARPTKSVR
jgi:transposase